ncbi:MAG: hypothetical protein ACYCXK_00850 [Candidatus Humimicrobiaceae bacterium]
MSMLLKIMQLWTPEFIREKKLGELFCLTADAFQSVLPNLRGLPFEECLSKYALFTKEQAESYLLSGGTHDETKYRLYKNSCIFGQKIRKNLNIHTQEEAFRALKVIYKLIGIDFQYDSQNGFIIKQCFFSKYYSGNVCKIISSLDEGLTAGLSNGGRLFFDQRITEGSSCCKGYLKWEL